MLCVRGFASLAYPGLIEDFPLAAHRTPFVPENWILEVLYCDPKGGRAFLRILCHRKDPGLKLDEVTHELVQQGRELSQ